VIIDTHAHVSSPDVRRYPTQYTLRGNSEMPTLGDYVRQIPVLPVEQFIAENDAAGIDATVVVQMYARYAYDNNYAADSVARVLQRFPDQRVALDHLGYPALDDGPPYAKAAPLFSLTACPNLTVKFSTDNIIAAAKGAGTQRAFFEQLIERFGPSRVMWSSNYNFIYSPGLAEQIATARSILSFLSPDETEQVFAGTAVRHCLHLRKR